MDYVDIVVVTKKQIRNIIVNNTESIIRIICVTEGVCQSHKDVASKINGDS